MTIYNVYTNIAPDWCDLKLCSHFPHTCGLLLTLVKFLGALILFIRNHFSYKNGITMAWNCSCIIFFTGCPTFPVISPGVCESRDAEAHTVQPTLGFSVNMGECGKNMSTQCLRAELRQTAESHISFFFFPHYWLNDETVQGRCLEKENKRKEKIKKKTESEDWRGERGRHSGACL